jgi:HSP20 family protein
MLMRFDPFRELDQVAQQVLRQASRSGAPMDAYRHGDQFIVQFTATRKPTFGDSDEVLVTERPHGEFRRQLFLGEQLDADNVSADYGDGVLTLTLSVAEQAKPRKVEISQDSKRKELAGSTA